MSDPLPRSLLPRARRLRAFGRSCRNMTDTTDTAEATTRPRRCDRLVDAVMFLRRCLSAPARGRRSARLLVGGVLAARGAELRQLDAVGVVAPILLRDVVAVLALRARKSDLGTDVGGLAGHGTTCLSRRGYCHLSLSAYCPRASPRAHRLTRLRDKELVALTTLVARAGLEPATPRL